MRRLIRPVLLLALAAAPVGAQQSDTTGSVPFRRGQWASQFGFDGQVASAGAVRFRSATSAWIVDASFDVARLEYEFETDDVDSGKSDGTDVVAALQLGLRGYRPVATRVNAFTGGGLYGQTYAYRQPIGGTQFLTQRGGAAGFYGELGATWMVTRNLGLGAATMLTATYEWSEVEQPVFGGEGNSTATGYGVGLRRSRLMATVFF